MKITCICSTYNHTTLLRNALACFLAQDYPAELRRLIIFEDGGQFANQASDNWRVIAHSERCVSLLEKHERLVEFDGGWADAFCIWDDDDCYLPWHVSAHANALQ